MKKIISILAMVVLLVSTMSCENDDDAYVNDPIVGTWDLIAIFVNNIEIPLEFCEDLEVLVFRNNGVFEDVFFVEDFDFDCVEDEIFVGSWEYVGGGNYRFENDIAVTVQNIIFNDSNTFSIFDTFTIDGFTFTQELIYVRD